MKHFYCDFHIQHLNLHKNWHISFLLVAKSEILYISDITALILNLRFRISEDDVFPYLHVLSLTLVSSHFHQRGLVFRFSSKQPHVLSVLTL